MKIRKKRILRKKKDLMKTILMDHSENYVRAVRSLIQEIVKLIFAKDSQPIEILNRCLELIRK